LSANGQATSDSTSDSTTVGVVREAASDSTKPILLPPVVVSSSRRNRTGDATWIPSSARFLYADDGSKLLLGDLRISSPLPASADLSLYGLPVEQTARDYVWGHRIGGPTTAVFGSRTKINPDIVQVALYPFLMSHQYRDTNGSLDLRPTFQSNHLQTLSMSSDAIERRATLFMARDRTHRPRSSIWSRACVRATSFLLEAAVPALSHPALFRLSDAHELSSRQSDDRRILSLWAREGRLA
jgi:hypothetical protein